MFFPGAPWVLPLVLPGWGVGLPLLEWVRGFLAVFLSLAPPPFCFSCCLSVSLVLFFLGGVCLLLPLPSLGWCTHWSAFGVANWVAVGACAWLGRAPAPSVRWVMYTLGLVVFPVGLGSRSAGCAVAPGGFVRTWVKGGGVFDVPPPLWCRS